MEARMMRCGLCNAKDELKNMKYHKSGEYLICKGCSEKQAPGAKVVVEKAPIASVKSVEEVSKKSVDKVSYRCKNCGYAFTRAKSHVLSVCPYCGKNTVSVVAEGGAQNILDSSVY
jgi:rubrerythrin